MLYPCHVTTCLVCVALLLQTSVRSKRAACPSPSSDEILFKLHHPRIAHVGACVLCSHPLYFSFARTNSMLLPPLCSLRQEPELVPIVFCETDQTLLRLGSGADVSAQVGDNLRVQRDSFPAKLIEAFLSDNETRSNNCRSERSERSLLPHEPSNWSLWLSHTPRVRR